MNDAAVVSGLMSRDCRFLFDNDKPAARLLANCLQSRGQADNPSTHDKDIEFPVQIHGLYFYKLPFHLRVKITLSFEKEAEMKHYVPLILGILVVAASAAGQSKSSDEKSTDKAQIVSTAEITKVDAKKMSLEVRQVAEAASSPTRQGGGRRGGGGGGRRGGGRRGGGGIGFPGGGGGGGGSRTTTQAKEFKVFVSKDTTMQFAGAKIDFSDLHVGDRITVSGTPKGGKGDLDATNISRQ
jgi:hypothetical protein